MPSAWAGAAPTVLAAFLASSVEFVEALTVVLAVGTTRGWRAALLGAGAAVVVLVALTAALGPQLTRIPLATVQWAVGTLLLMFGLRWLRKAVLRAAGIIPLHDETRAFETHTARLATAEPVRRRRLDPAGLAMAFKIVLLEGIEVVFIVVAVGATGNMLAPAALGAGAALLLVVVLGLALHRPLARVPENGLKLAVGVLLSAFGTFWVGEGFGMEWPASDLSLLVLIAAFLLIAMGLGRVCRRRHRRRVGGIHAARGAGEPRGDRPSASTQPRGSSVARAAAELLGLFVDDPSLALGIVGWVLCAWLARPLFPFAASGVGAMFAAGLFVLLATSTLRAAR